MNSLEPAVILGSHYWNQELLPQDEFAARLRAARALMESNRWDGLLVFGDCAEPGMLAWLTNVCPRMRWTAALFGRTGEPTLVVPGAVRDFPITAVMTPITDIRSWGVVVEVLSEWVEGLEAKAGPGSESRPAGRPAVAVYGFGRMQPSQRAGVERGLARADVTPVAGELEALMSATRPREAHLLREGCAVLKLATDAFRSALAGGSRPGEAALHAEKTARLKGAHDVRILLSRDRGRTLEPFFSVDVDKDGATVAYIGLRFLGYWVEALVTDDAPKTLEGPVKATLKELVTQLKPGASRTALAGAAAAQLRGLDPHAVFGVSAVKRLGLSLDEDVLGQGGEDLVQPGAMYSLRVAASGPDGAAAVSALVRNGEVLWGP
jgi:hypothetical protein